MGSFNVILPESRETIGAVKVALHCGGYKTADTITKPGTKKSKEISSSLTAKAKRPGKQLIQK
jgi:hypothetical protein